MGYTVARVSINQNITLYHVFHLVNALHCNPCSMYQCVTLHHVVSIILLNMLDCTTCFN